MVHIVRNIPVRMHGNFLIGIIPMMGKWLSSRRIITNYKFFQMCFPTLSAEQYPVRVAFRRTSLRILRTANLGQDVYVKEGQSKIGSNGTMTCCRVLRQDPLGL